MASIIESLQQNLNADNFNHAVDRLLNYASSPLHLIAVVGALYLSSWGLAITRGLLNIFVLPGESLKKYGAPGTWAVVTGASDGIGKEFALQLAAKKYNLLLISRTATKLNTLAQEIEKGYGVDTIVFPMDFSQNKDSDYASLGKAIKDIDISILINNVGQSHSIPVTFLETEPKEMTDIVTINVLGTLRITQLIAPKLVARRRGLILTMASFAGLVPTPLLATYSGSKAFLQYWSSALGSELAPHGVRVQLVQSHLVTSAMSKIRRSSVLVPTPKEFVRAALGKIGGSGGSTGRAWTSTPYWSHGLYHWALQNVTGTMNTLVVGINGEMHEKIRARALKKREREAKKQ